MQILPARLLQKSWFVPLSIVFGAIAALKGMRPPSLWAATQSQLSYGFGFIKRGLFGEVARHLGIHLYHYRVFMGLSWALLIVCVTTLIGVCIRFKVYRHLDTAIVATLMWSSFAVSYLFHLVGYYDVLLFAAALVVVCIRDPLLQIICAAVVAVLGVLIHESYLLLFLPLTLARPTLDIILSSKTWGDALRRGIPILAVVAIAFAVTFAIVDGRPWTHEQDLRHFALLSSQADFPLRGDFPDVESRSLEDNLLLMRDFWAGSHRMFRHAAFSMFLFWPTGILVLIATSLRLATVLNGWRLVAGIALVLANAAAPLGMMIIGFDLERWHAIALLGSFVLFAIVAAAIPREDPSAPTLMSVLLLAAISLNLIASGGWFDHYHAYQGARELVHLIGKAPAAWPLPVY